MFDIFLLITIWSSLDYFELGRCSSLLLFPQSKSPDDFPCSLGLMREAPVAQSVERWTCDWKAAGSNPGLEGPCGAISIYSALSAVPVFRKRHKTEAPSQSPNGAGSLN